MKSQPDGPTTGGQPSATMIKFFIHGTQGTATGSQLSFMPSNYKEVKQVLPGLKTTWETIDDIEGQIGQNIPFYQRPLFGVHSCIIIITVRKDQRHSRYIIVFDFIFFTLFLNIQMACWPC